MCLVVASFQVAANPPSGSQIKGSVLKPNWEQTRLDQSLFIMNALKGNLLKISCAPIQDLIKK